MNNYRIKYNPATNLPLETRQYTLWKLEEFLGMEYGEDAWDQDVGVRPNRKRSAILYALRQCTRKPEPDRFQQLVNECRKWGSRQPEFWPRFLREKYPMAMITDFFSVPHDDVRNEFYQYEYLAEDAGLIASETGKVFDPIPHIQNIKRIMGGLSENMNMEAALA